MPQHGGTTRTTHGFGSNRPSEKLHRKEILRIYFPKNNQRTTGALFASSALDAISGGFHAKAGLVPRANLVKLWCHEKAMTVLVKVAVCFFTYGRKSAPIFSEKKITSGQKHRERIGNAFPKRPITSKTNQNSRSYP